MQVSGVKPAAHRAAILLIFVVGSILGASSAHAGIIVVSGSSNPFLADAANALAKPLDGTIPPFLDLSKTNYKSLNILSFGAIAASSPLPGLAAITAHTVSGSYAPGPDGGSDIVSVASTGLISGFNLPANSLVGVFWGPGLTKAPNPANNSPVASTVLPELGQVFFIGDGLNGTGTGNPQGFLVPLGATRLYFGTANSGNWSGGQGVIQVFATKAIPEPSSVVLMLAGLALSAGCLCRRRVSPKTT